MGRLAGTFTLALNFDAAAMRRLHKMEEFDGILAAFLQEAMSDSLDNLEEVAQLFMLDTFEHIDQSDTIATKFKKRVSSPYKGILGNYQKYAQRLNYGFSGMTDSLGRYYAFWPDYHWAEHTIEIATPYTYERFSDAVREATDEAVS